MSEENAFKHQINSSTVAKISREIQKVFPDFNAKGFSRIAPGLHILELKDRVRLLASGLKKYLPSEFKEAVTILMKVIENGELKGFELWPFSEFIGQFGLNDFKLSFKAMHSLTQKFTSEFAIRPYLLKDHRKALNFLLECCSDKNSHVRRWASEGSRPLLPWGERIPLFVMDPTHTLVILDRLRYDEELYVRKSVANHLNDISKNHPDVVVKVLKWWEKECPPEHKQKIEWIKRHSLRSLIKKGNPSALKFMGVNEDVKLREVRLALNQKKYRVNEVLEFFLTIKSASNEEQKLLIDYKIEFVKANGSKSCKVFKLKTVQLNPGETLQIKKTHSLRPITTMKYYSGLHHVHIQINGKVMKKADFQLEI